MAAVLAGGPDAVLSHESAAALWGIAPESSGPIEIAVPANSGRRCPGVRIYRRMSLTPADVTERDRIPVISPVLTLVELAGIGYVRLEQAVNEADRLDLVDPEELRVSLEVHRGRRGVRRLRELLDRRTFRLTDSELE
ncbi:MAG TPA: type IV toxin-antitoxin system AbiEi family antitoxin, partial [Solirubrobacterales bacterium]|nr:type IV toxin-antitoxin system AbiEi family antitoxin [Solirubrobacterales bacterium]